MFCHLDFICLCAILCNFLHSFKLTLIFLAYLPTNLMCLFVFLFELGGIYAPKQGRIG